MNRVEVKRLKKITQNNFSKSGLQKNYLRIPFFEVVAIDLLI